MTPEERALVDGARRRAWDATEGPWETIIASSYYDTKGVASARGVGVVSMFGSSEKDAVFIAHARTDVPALCDLADRQEAELAAKDARVAELEAELARRPT